MAQQVITQLVDDLDGGEATQTITFSWGSAQYEIDLNDKNTEKMAKALAPFIEKARKTSSRGRSTTAKTSKSRTDLAEIREWAKKNGHEVSDRGRIAQEVIDAYDARR
jgi:hypothetical protein